MSNIRILFSLFFTVLSIHQVAGQLKDNYIKSSILLKDNRVISGYIRQDELEKIRLGIYYKMLPTDNQRTFYHCTDLQQVSLENGRIYETVHCIIPVRTDSLTNDTVSILASLLLKGKASLYETSYKGKDAYILVTNGQSHWLQDDEIIDGQLVRYHYQNILFSVLRHESITENDAERTSFNDKDLLRLVTRYNEAYHSPGKLIQADHRSINYIIAGLGGMYLRDTRNEFYLQAVYRSYFPGNSKSTSLNIGLSYYRDVRKTDIDGYANDVILTRNLLTVPIFVQQNLLNRSVRPNIQAGLNLSHITENDNNNISFTQHGLQRNYGVGFLLGAGIEVDVLKHLLLKADYKYENFAHLALAGIAYKLQL
ncbi:PorT family protein [Pedobacter sp. BS3]|uniref:PorT family protein n=1 Tax=Pedobacter sp. BS3 TaxID=2567937 RepID=UPI0011EC35AF|nr:PorT family protein [Pedobacter sp. BS3]TZF82644.1 PorT family protein [Pedobacter sp. BS3]